MTDNPDWHINEDGFWQTGTGQVIRQVHDPEKCLGDNCTVHNPSDHPMRSWKTHLRIIGPFDIHSSPFTERLCPEHGTGHPDPDDIMAPDIHGCCGCCSYPKKKDWREVLHEKHGYPVCGPISVGDGWRKLVQLGYKVLDALPCCSATQVKEKFGELRFYIDHDYECKGEDCYDTAYSIMDILTMASRIRCEECGASSSVRKITDYYIKSVCDSCYDRLTRDA